MDTQRGASLLLRLPPLIAHPTSVLAPLPSPPNECTPFLGLLCKGDDAKAVFLKAGGLTALLQVGQGIMMVCCHIINHNINLSLTLCPIVIPLIA